jgi:PhnB protein
MPKRSLSEQLEEAVEAIMAKPDAPPAAVDPRLAELLRIASDLRDLPAPELKNRLKADLQRAQTSAHVATPIPAGHHSTTPCLVIRDAPRAIEFYKEAFGATELMRLEDDEGHIVHAEIQIGDSPIAIAGEAVQWGNHSPQSLGGSSVILQIYVDDVDTLATRAVAAGAKVVFPVADQFYGDRAGRLADPFGHLWIIATHKEDVTPAEMQKRAEAFLHQAAEAAKPAGGSSYSVEPYLPVRGAAALIEFLKQAFGAQETSRHLRADGSIAHANIRIGDSSIGTGDSTTTEAAAMPTAIHLYVPDADAVYARALQAGATSMQEPADQDYGDREAGVRDPFGNNWYIATHQGGSKTPAATYIPAGLHSVTPYLHPHGAPALIEFLKQAFAAQEAFRHQTPDGTVVHAKIRIGESIVEMGEAHGPYQPMPTVFHLYVNDTDVVYRQALQAGAASLSEPADQAWGYRNAGVQDPGGNQWWINAPLDVPAAADAPTEKSAAAEPTSLRSVTPFLQVRDVRAGVDFLKRAFGAELLLFDRGGDPPHDHAEVRIGDSVLMMGETVEGYGPTTSAFHLRVDDADAMYERALQAGVTALQAPKDMPWGDRMASVQDALGNHWFISARKKTAPR